MRVFILLVCLPFLFFSCDRSRDLHVDVSDQLPGGIEIRRYGDAIFSMDSDDFTIASVKGLHDDFPFFVTPDPDSAGVLMLRDFVLDPVNQDLYGQVMEKYPHVSDIREGLEGLFRHIKYYFPDYRVPLVYTYVSSLNHELPVIYEDSVLVIALDMYLGGQTRYYDKLGLPRYISRWYIRERMIPEVCQTIVSRWIQSEEDPSLLDHMVRQGKIQYLMDAFLPDTDRSYKIRYTPKQMEWMEDSEAFVWGYILENELLYSSDRSRLKPFVDEAPFTAAISREAPPRMAQWYGWRIVTSYMDNNRDYTIRQLLQEDRSHIVLRESGYKPHRRFF